MNRLILALGASALAARIAGLAFAQDRMPAPAGAEVYIISPQNGATVHGPVTVQFGLKGMGVAPAGSQVRQHGPPSSAGGH